MITTSRKPSRRSRTLGRDLERVLIGKYITRGKANIETLVEKARIEGQDRIILIYDIHGNPGKLQSIVVDEDSWSWHPLILNLSGVSLQREVLANMRIKKVSFRDVFLENHTKHDVIDFFGLSVNEESRNKMVVNEDAITFYMGRREVGPRIKVKEWYYAKPKNQD